MRGLLYKNFAVTWKYVLLMLAASFAIPLVLVSSMDGIPVVGTISLVISSVYVVFFCLLYLTRKESEYHSAVALVSTASYSRFSMVAATYLYAYILLAVSWLAFGVDALFVPALRGAGSLGFAFTFALVSVLIGILLPCVYCLGYDRTRIVFGVLILVTPFLMSGLENTAGFATYLQTSAPAMTALLWCVGAAVLAGSIMLSVRAFSRAELA